MEFQDCRVRTHYLAKGWRYIFAGIHFRAACDDGQATGIQVANYVLENALQRLPATRL